MRYRLSILVVAKNEEKQIANCLDTLNFGDEIVVILDSCNDNTKKITKKYTKTIYSGSWKNEGERRNYGISKCTNNWILEIDADEIVDKNLLKEANDKILSLPDNMEGYFLIPFDNYIGKKRVRYGWGASWGVSAKPCLFHKNSKIWGQNSKLWKILFKHYRTKF